MGIIMGESSSHRKYACVDRRGHLQQCPLHASVDGIKCS